MIFLWALRRQNILWALRACMKKSRVVKAKRKRSWVKILFEFHGIVGSIEMNAFSRGWSFRSIGSASLLFRGFTSFHIQSKVHREGFPLANCLETEIIALWKNLCNYCTGIPFTSRKLTEFDLPDLIWATAQKKEWSVLMPL